MDVQAQAFILIFTITITITIKLGNGRCTSSGVTDKNLAAVGLDVGTNQGDNDPTRPLRRHARVPTVPFKAKH